MKLLTLPCGDIIEVTFNTLYKQCEFTIDDTDILINTQFFESAEKLDISINESEPCQLHGTTSILAYQLENLGADVDDHNALAIKINFIIEYMYQTGLLINNQQHSGLCRI